MESLKSNEYLSRNEFILTAPSRMESLQPHLAKVVFPTLGLISLSLTVRLSWRVRALAVLTTMSLSAAAAYGVSFDPLPRRVEQQVNRLFKARDRIQKPRAVLLDLLLRELNNKKFSQLRNISPSLCELAKEAESPQFNNILARLASLLDLPPDSEFVRRLKKA